MRTALIRLFVQTLRLRPDAPFPSQIRRGFHRLVRVS